MCDTVTISREEYDGLCWASLLLQALVDEGVGDWARYDDAIITYNARLHSLGMEPSDGE